MFMTLENFLVKLHDLFIKLCVLKNVIIYDILLIFLYLLLFLIVSLLDHGYLLLQILVLDGKHLKLQLILFKLEKHLIKLHLLLVFLLADEVVLLYIGFDKMVLIVIEVFYKNFKDIWCEALLAIL